jgi:hypothetical protein
MPSVLLSVRLSGPSIRNWRFSQRMMRCSVRVHQTLRVTPAMEAGIASHVWSIEEIVGLLGCGGEKSRVRNANVED